MYKKTRAENRSSNYQIEVAGAQFFTSTNQNCLGGSFVMCKNLNPTQVQEATVPDRPCEVAYSVVTFNWKYIPSGQGGTAQSPRLPFKGGANFLFYWTDPKNLDTQIFSADAVAAPLFEIEELDT